MLSTLKLSALKLSSLELSTGLTSDNAARKTALAGIMTGRLAAIIAIVGAGIMAEAQALAAKPLALGERVSLDGTWRFRIDRDQVGEQENWPGAAIDGNWRDANVPGEWDSITPPSFDGVGWYSREFDAPAVSSDLKLGLVLHAVDDEATVWINGNKIDQLARYGRVAGIPIDAFIKPGKNRIDIRVLDTGSDGGLVGSVELAPYRDPRELAQGQYRNLRARDSYDWVQDAFIYQVYLRSMSPEGTFKGLEQRLDHIKSLGVNVIWLMPIHPVGEVKRKGSLGSPYAVKDYKGVNPEFGTLDDFKSLLKAAHERDIKIILDWVANHTAWDHPWITEHPDWYTRDANGEVIPPNADWTDVADLNFDKREVWDAMIDAMLFWVRDVGIDGFRCDVAGLVPHEFWVEVVPKLHAVKPVLMLAEDDQPRQHVDAFDMTYDWDLYAVLETLRSGYLEPSRIRTLLLEQDERYPRGALRMRFTTNHDKNAWEMPSIERYGKSSRAAIALTFALPGIPLIYNGQEIGNDRKLSLFEKVDIDWSQTNEDLTRVIREMARARAELAPLRRGGIAIMDSALPLGVLVIRRSHAGEAAFVVINFRDDARTLKLGEGLPSALTAVAGDAKIVGDQIEIGPYGFLVAK